MRRLYLALDHLARRFFAATGMPVPGFVRRAHRLLRTTVAERSRHDLRKEVEALARAVERLETMAYLDEIGRQSD